MCYAKSIGWTPTSDILALLVVESAWWLWWGLVKAGSNVLKGAPPIYVLEDENIEAEPEPGQ